MLAGALAPLAAIPSPSWDGLELGPLKVHAYALCIILGIILALWLASRRWEDRNGPEGAVLDVAIWAIPFGFVGGRLYHVLSSPDRYFGPGFDGTGDPVQAFYVWNGGLGIWGAVALGAVGAWIACRRRGLRLSAFADVVAPGVLLAQAVGRWGNWFNQELFGAPTTLPWGLRIDPSHANFPVGTPADTLFHPTFLYESLWNLAGVALLLLLDRRLHLRHGAMLWAYVAWYTLGRVWIEMLRIDDAEMITLFGVTQRLNVWTSLLLLLVALVMLVWTVAARGAIGPRTPERDDVWLPGRAPAVAAGAQGRAGVSGHTVDDEGGSALGGSDARR